MRRHLTFCLSFFAICNGVWAQSACDFEPSDKTVKLLEKSNDKKKYDSDKRYEFLVDALDEEDNCYPCLLRLGEIEFKRSKRTGANFGTAENYLTRIAEDCPEFHFETFYYLGAINYANQNYDAAVDYFDQFLKFTSDDADMFDRGYEKMVEEVEGALPQVKFWQEFYEGGTDIEPELVTGVSSAVDDYLPAISPDGEIMFYTRVVNKQAKGDLYSRKIEEFTWSLREDINHQFDDGNPLPSPFNQGDNYGGATISVDNKEMYIAKKNPAPGNPENIDIFYTRYELVYNEFKKIDEYRWSELQDIGPNINTTDGFEGQPSLSGDGQMLFFAKVGPQCMTDKEGNFTHDIYMSQKQPDGSWGVAKGLGSVINTNGHDKVPFMHGDSKTLYFASDGHLGRGGLDIFFSRLKDDGTWSEPKNMGHPVNTIDDESGLIVSSDGEKAYFFSRKLKGSRGYDIYSFSMPDRAKPDRVMVLKGDIKGESGKPLERATVELTYVQSKEAQQIDVDQKDGRYAAIVNLSKNEDVVMTVKSEDIAFNSRIVANKDAERKPSVVKFEVKAEVVEKDKPFVINDIYYATNKADITRESTLILDAFAEYLNENPNLYIEIRGHTDDVGSDDANLALSMDRAFEVKRHLESKGISGSRITARGFGETMPVADNTSEEGRALNRRTEFVVKKM